MNLRQQLIAEVIKELKKEIIDDLKQEVLSGLVSEIHHVKTAVNGGVSNPITDTSSVVVNLPEADENASVKNSKKELGPELIKIYDKDAAERAQFIKELNDIVTHFPTYKVSHVSGTKSIHYYEECATPTGAHRLYVCDVVGLHERELSLEEIKTKRKVPCRKCHGVLLKKLKKIIPVTSTMLAAPTSLEVPDSKIWGKEVVKKGTTNKFIASTENLFQLDYPYDKYSARLDGEGNPLFYVNYNKHCVPVNAKGNARIVDSSIKKSDGFKLRNQPNVNYSVTKKYITSRRGIPRHPYAK